MDASQNQSPSTSRPPRPARSRFNAAAARGIGLQGRVILCFVGLLLLTLSATLFTFVRHTREHLTDIIGEQARQMSASLALANERSVRLGNTEDLNRIGRELIKSRNILYVGFWDPDGQRISLSSRDADIDLKHVGEVRTSAKLLMQLRSLRSPLFGEYLETVAPVLSHASGGGSKLVGYVAVGVSRDGEAARLHSIKWEVLAISGLALVLAGLVGTVLVHRIFTPIRELVAATHKITQGDLETRVAIERTDAIGQLARAFNEMVEWVKQQQRELATANEKLLDANRDLEEKITLRTAQLETANNRLSTEIADKEEFLRAVSHDLSAPLRNIDGMASFLLMKHRDALNADIIHRLERIKANVEMESGLIAELLELSRIKTRRLKLEPVDLDALVRSLRDVFEDDLQTRGIELVIDSPLPTIECEKSRLRQVFQNLIDNAIKYMAPDGAGELGRPRRINIGCTPRLTEVEFYVRDTGIGIHADDLDKVFLVFRRGKNIAASSASGKGVGLASVKSIIETYNGRIWVESKLGEGSVFRFTVNGRYLATNSPGTASGDQPVNRAA